MNGSRQTAQPLPDYRLSASNKTAREVARNMVPLMDMNPPYQRGAVWTVDQQIALVKSWAMGVPVPAVILNDRDTPAWAEDMGPLDYGADDVRTWAVVDGKQRIETAVAWYAGMLAVPASWFPTSHVEATVHTADGPYVVYTGLSRPWQRRLGTSCMLPVVEARLPSLRAEAELYLLVNGGGTGQSEEDMTRAVRIAGTHCKPKVRPRREAEKRT
jgi:hypothetical protein